MKDTTTTTEWLPRLCTIFATHTRRRLSTVSRLATGSGETLARLERGRTITIRRAARALQYLSDHWPDDGEWPAEIPRPPRRRAVTPEVTDTDERRRSELKSRAKGGYAAT